MITADLIAWLQQADLGTAAPVPVYQGPSGPDAEPREHLVVSPIPGGRLTTDGYLEQAAYQIRTVGPQGGTTATHNATAATSERLAQTVDRLMLTAERPVMGDTQVISITRLGSKPTGQALDKARRYPLTAVYVVEAEAGIY